MRAVITTPAATAASRDGLELTIRERRENKGSTTLLLGVGEGAVKLVLGAPAGRFIFSHGPVRLSAGTAAEGRAFVDEVARWFALELTPAHDGADAPLRTEDARDRRRPRLRASWIQLGDGTDPSGVAWHTYKLCLDLGERGVEIFLRLSADGRRAQLVEKFSLHRRELVELFERVLSKGAPRVVRERRPPSVDANRAQGRLVISIDGVVDVALPPGWRASKTSDGQQRLTDASETMMIEVSHHRIPARTRNLPKVAERLRRVLAECDLAGGRCVKPITTAAGDGFDYAWTEYEYRGLDSKKPRAAPRAAYMRWLIASNAWHQAFVTGGWWHEDAARAEEAWDGIVGSLKLAGRSAETRKPQGEA